MPRSTRTATAALLIPLLATACFGSSGSTASGSGGEDRSSPAALTITLYRHLAAGKFEKVCGLFGPAALKRITDTGADCQPFLAKHYDEAARAGLRDVKVDASAIRVNGDTAVVPQSSVTFDGHPSHDGDTQESKQDGKWSISG